MHVVIASVVKDILQINFFTELITKALGQVVQSIVVWSVLEFIVLELGLMRGFLYLLLRFSGNQGF